VPAMQPANMTMNSTNKMIEMKPKVFKNPSWSVLPKGGTNQPGE